MYIGLTPRNNSSLAKTLGKRDGNKSINTRQKPNSLAKTRQQVTPVRPAKTVNVQKVTAPKPQQRTARHGKRRQATLAPHMAPQQYMPANPGSKDFFASSLPGSMPERVFVVATGPNGNPHFDKIPDNAYIIAVNQGILIKPNANLWMVFDYRCALTKWWPAAIKLPTTRLWSRRIMSMFPCQYTFISTPSAIYPDCSLRAKALRGGATISGCAIQAAYYGGAKEIVLCGVDMAGRMYYDGGVNNNVSVRGNNGTTGNWINLPTLNGLIKSIEERGTKIVSLSPTSLDIPTIKKI